MLRTEISTADIGLGVGSLGQSEISRDVSQNDHGLNTDPKRIQAGGGGSPKTLRRQSQGCTKMSSRAQQTSTEKLKNCRALRWTE